VRLTFWHWFDFWTGVYGASTWCDGGTVEISGDAGATWTAATEAGTTGTLLINPNMGSSYACHRSTSFYVHGREGYVGASAGWRQVSIPVPRAFRTAAFAVRFLYATGVSYRTTNQNTSMLNARPGWYIDDAAVVIP
jgi:hypothetical protein